MAKTSDITLVIRDSVGALVTTGAYDLRTPDFSSAGVSGTYANGKWTFADLTGDEPYRLFNTGTGTYAGWGGDDGTYIFDGDVGAADVEAGTFTGDFVFTNPLTVGTATSSGHALRYSQGAKLASNETVTGNWTFNGTSLQISGSTNMVINGTFRPQIGSSATTNAGAAGAMLRADEIAALISSAINNLPQSIVISPYERWVIYNVTEVSGKIYNTVAAAVTNILSVATPSATQRFTVKVFDSGNTGYRNVPHSAIVDYVDIVSESTSINLIIGSTGESTTHTKTMRFKDFNIWFGNGLLTGARTYNGIYWENCQIRGYQNLTFGGTGKLVRTKIYQGTGKTLTITGPIELDTVGCSQAITYTTYTGKIYGDVNDSVDTTRTMESDPTVE